MTLDQFFALLEKTPRDWRRQGGIDGHRIRRDGLFCVQCPLTAVAGFGERKGFWTYGDPSYWCAAAKEIGLRQKSAEKILSAADGRGHLRRRLLAACGLAGTPEVSR